jgi:hypothetical protein
MSQMKELLKFLLKVLWKFIKFCTAFLVASRVCVMGLESLIPVWVFALLFLWYAIRHLSPDFPISFSELDWSILQYWWITYYWWVYIAYGLRDFACILAFTIIWYPFIGVLLPDEKHTWFSLLKIPFIALRNLLYTHVILFILSQAAPLTFMLVGCFWIHLQERKKRFPGEFPKKLKFTEIIVLLIYCYITYLIILSVWDVIEPYFSLALFWGVY